METRGRPLAALVLALLAALLLAPQALAQSTPITGLDWGLKASWRNYITAAGTSMLEGATLNADGTFHFPVAEASYDPATKATIVQFSGGVQFLGHCEPVPYERPCQLDLTLLRPRVEITEEHATLYAKVSSRPITGGEIAEYPDVELATLEVDGRSPAVAGGTTTWSGIPSTLTVAGAAIFTYAPNTVLDSVTFAYAGPGGSPALEAWTPSDTPLYESQALGAESGLLTLRPGFTADEVIGVYEYGVKVLNRTTFAPKAQTTARLDPRSVASDPVTKTVFGGGPTNVGHLWAYTWDGTSFTGGRITDAGEGNGKLAGGGVWDAANNRYLVARYSSATDTDTELWEVVRSGSAWTPRKIGPIVAPSGRPIARHLNSLALVQDGQASAPKRLIAASSGQPLQLWVQADRAVVEPLPEAAGTEGLWLQSTANGVYIVGPVGKIWFMPLQVFFGFGALAAPGPPAQVTGTLPSFDRTAVDVATDTLYVTAKGGTALARIQSGVLRHVFPLPDQANVSYGTQLAGVLGGRLVVGYWVDQGKTSRSYGYLGTSPSVNVQPTDTAVVLRTDTETAKATFITAVAADPAATIRWQSRPAGGRWADIAPGAGATGQNTERLQVTVGLADTGTRYRAVLTNLAGSLATAAARLEVETPPAVAVQPASATVVEGAAARFDVMPAGNPVPAVQWQQRVGGFWRDVDTDTGDLAADGGHLTVTSPNLAMDGTQFRARLRNDVDTTYSRTVTLTVSRPLTQAVTFGGGTVDWGFANRWRCYVVGNVARGQIEVSGGVEKLPGTLAGGSLCTGRNAGSEVLRFPIKGGTFDDGKLELTLRGSVRFWGHDYHVPGNTTPQLDTRFTNLRIVIDGGTGTLLADTAGATMENPTPVTRTNVPLVRVNVGAGGATPVDGGLSWTGLETALTAEGSTVFGSYPEGEPFDPLSIVAKYGTPQTTPDPEPEVTPVPVPAATPPPPPTPTVTPAPPAKAKVTKPKKAPTLSTKRTASLATVACPKDAAGGCRVSVPKSVRVTIAGRRYTAMLSTTTRLVAGRSAIVRLRLSSVAAGRLRSRSVKVKVKVTTTIAGKAASSTVSVTLKGRSR